MQICVNNVCKRYKRKRGEKGFINNLKALFNSNYEYIDAIKGVSFNLDKGEIVGYIGANGSGKSTTIKMLCGILTPDSGEITVDGRNVDIRNRSFKKNIGVVFGQRSNLWNDLPASDTFSLFKYIYEISEEEFEKNYRFIDGFLNVSSIENVAVRKLSLGQRMKCEICAAMLHFPDILFLDEPTIGLDINIRKSVMALMKEYNIKFNKTIIITSHNLDDIEELCSRVIIIDKGKILVEETLDKIKELYQRYKFVEILYKDDNSLNAGNIYFEELYGISADTQIQGCRQVYKIPADDNERMDQLMNFIVQNKNIMSFQVYRESLESIVGNIIG